MSSTFGQPGFVSSNRTGSSGVSQSNIGSLGSGVLQTIEESAAAQLADVFYYDKSVGYYNLPSVQRSHGDDYKTCNVTSFGARGTITLPRKFFNFGPCPIRFQLPIDYAWSGCEYVSNVYTSNYQFDCIDAMTGGAAGAGGNAGVNIYAGEPIAATDQVVRPYNMPHVANGARFHFESPGCSTMLPTSFQSGGMAFAFPQQIELNMGGAGLLQFDRYSNWVAIMASCPFQKQRADLMRLAGGGLCLDSEEDAKAMPVQWGLVDWAGSTGTTQHNSTFPVHTAMIANGTGGTNVTGAISISELNRKKHVPVMWDVLLPIKTPETNFMYSLERRKPLDTSCFASDFQMTFSWSNFNEWSDTGKGYPNAPIYYPQDMVDALHATPFGATFPTKFDAVIGKQTPYTGIAPPQYLYASSFQTTPALSVFTSEIGAPLLIKTTGGVSSYFQAATADMKKSFIPLCNAVALNPSVWTNHYRVASGGELKSTVHFKADSNIYRWSDATGAETAGAGARAGIGRCRLPQLIVGNFDASNANTTALAQNFHSLQRPADLVNDYVSYPPKFSLVEYVNSSLKLTNPALGAYNALRVDKEAVLYYPLQYFYSQVYRVTTSPWTDFKNVSSGTLRVFESKLKDLTSQSNKITQMIQMPANPCTALFTSIFREKDRQTLVTNKLNSYSPALFWLALNPIRMDLKDGGNTLFSYKNNVDFELYSLMDRPDALKVPFKGGHVKVSPKNVYGSRYICSTNVNMPSYPNKILGNTVAADYITDTFINYQGETAATARESIWWLTGFNGATGLGVYSGKRGINSMNPNASHPASSANAYPADHLVDSIAIKNGLRVGGGNKPCHTVDNYESTIIEFPFVMAEPLTTEKIVQQTPSFARTQLQLDFWIDPFVKPDNGFDDMYDVTYGLTRPVPSGVPCVLDDQKLGQGLSTFNAVGSFSHPVPDCLHEGGAGVFDPYLLIRDQIGKRSQDGAPESGALGTGISALLDPRNVYQDGYLYDQSNSWNINNGNLMLHVLFAQNQVWTISPLRTSLLQARG